jgi:hypothetical protein
LEFGKHPLDIKRTVIPRRYDEGTWYNEPISLYSDQVPSLQKAAALDDTSFSPIKVLTCPREQS